jgi:acyl carrier protein
MKRLCRNGAARYLLVGEAPSPYKRKGRDDSVTVRARRRPAQYPRIMPDRLITLFADVLHIDEARLSEDSSPDTIEEWDSVGAMTLMAAFEHIFGIRLTTRDFMTMNSVAMVREVLRKKGVADV